MRLATNKTNKSGAKHWLRAFCLTVGLSLGLSLTMQSAFAAKATLNLKDTDIQVFIESVSRITGKTFIIDPRVKNKKVTVISQHEMNEEEIFALFLSVLQVHQFSAVENNGVYKIEQLQAAKQDAVPVYEEGGKQYKGDQLVTRVIKVDNVDVGQLVPLLRTLVSTQGHMAQYKPTNVMVIHDTAANLERIVKIIRQIDRESNEEIEVIQLQHASAGEVVRILEALEKQSGQPKGPTTNKPKFVADERMNSILLSADKKSRLRLRGLIARLDSEISSTGNTKVIYLKYAKAEELAALLEGVGESIEKEEGKDNKASRRGNDKAYSIKAHVETNALVITAAPDLMRSF
ncbi:MAG: type II secretion system protein GspD, partial [Kangiellaceae bacterium]|nr:type II secretion system protein GspD [Kangiellaceae bacterium]